MLGLAFSGGRDSLACWYLTREQDPLVLWVNTGKAYPETKAIVREVMEQAKSFLEVKTDQAGQNGLKGLPSDLVPVNLTPLGTTFVGGKPRVQSYQQCCLENIGLPLLTAAKKAGVTELVYGQRDEDSHKSPARHGDAVLGIVRLHPIANWTRVDVDSYLLAQRGELPAHFALDHSSMDCYDCTAYLAHSADRVKWMKSRYPELYVAWLARMSLLDEAVAPSVKLLGELQCL